jgi:Tfp pilus assembly protein PilF
MARETVETLCQKAQAALSQGNSDAALEWYKKALALRADHPDTHYGLATIYFLKNDLVASAHHFREVTRYDPGKAGAFINLGAVYNRLEQYDDAIAALRRGISLDHGRAEGYYNLGLVYRKLGQIDMAVQAYREATRVNPRMGDAHYNIANIYLERGQFAQAEQHYRNALEIRPNWAKATRGLEQVEQLLNEQDADKEAATSPAPTRGKSDSGPKVIGAGTPLNPDRLVDPQVHGDLLKALHRSTIDADNVGRELLTVLTKELEPAIKELSTTLLYPDRSSLEIHEHVQRFDAALVAMRTFEENLQNSVERVRMLSEQLIRS